LLLYPHRHNTIPILIVISQTHHPDISGRVIANPVAVPDNDSDVAALSPIPMLTSILMSTAIVRKKYVKYENLVK